MPFGARGSNRPAKISCSIDIDPTSATDVAIDPTAFPAECNATISTANAVSSAQNSGLS